MDLVGELLEPQEWSLVYARAISRLISFISGVTSRLPLISTDILNALHGTHHSTRMFLTHSHAGTPDPVMPMT